VELLAAPVLTGRRYVDRPIYFSDVIVRRDSGLKSFADLRGQTWAYNDKESHSGYNLTRYHLLTLGETNGYFGRVIEAGSHQNAIRLVAGGEADASAIDSHVLELVFRSDPELRSALRVIESLGPSTIQPVVAARHLPGDMKAEMKRALTEMHRDAAVRGCLSVGMIKRFEAVSDATYDDIRLMLRTAESAGFMRIK
jgi:phosphonate transport system substrate-binding protein